MFEVGTIYCISWSRQLNIGGEGIEGKYLFFIHIYLNVNLLKLVKTNVNLFLFPLTSVDLKWDNDLNECVYCSTAGGVVL